MEWETKETSARIRDKVFKFKDRKNPNYETGHRYQIQIHTARGGFAFCLDASKEELRALVAAAQEILGEVVTSKVWEEIAEAQTAWLLRRGEVIARVHCSRCRRVSECSDAVQKDEWVCLECAS